MALSISRADDMLDDDLRESVEGIFETETEAREVIKNLLREYGTEGVVYRCIPTSEIKRQPKTRRLSTRSLLTESDAT
jgi:hypothetical protein